MTQDEIRTRISENNAKINEFLLKGIFVLNADIVTLLTENSTLQSQCRHSFVDGFCEYCDLEEHVNA